MTARKTKDGDATQDDANPKRCESVDDAGQQCWFVEHDDSIEHVYDEAEADKIAAEGVVAAPPAPEPAPEPAPTAPEADVTTESGAETEDAPAHRAKRRHASRVSENAWWCAICDTASPHDTKVCPSCGTVRIEDE